MSAVLTTIKIILFVSVFVVKLGQGLDIAPDDLRFFRTRRGLMVRSFLTVVVFMPILALVVILILQPVRPMAIAIAILAASPAAPLAVTKVRVSGGAFAYGASLQLTIAVLAVLTTPLVLWLMGLALGFQASLRPFYVAAQVAVAQLIPIGLGVYIAAKAQRLEKAGRVLFKIAVVILLAAIALILVRLSGVFLQTDARSYGAIILTVAGSLALGHALAPRDTEMQTALAVETAMRNPGLALFIASMNFPQAKPLPLLIPYLVIFLVVSVLYVQWQKRRGERAAGLTTRETPA